MAEEEAAGSPAEAEAVTLLMEKYEVGKLVGVGAFGKVYHAREVGTGQSVAIKAVSRRKIVKGGYTAHVKREISIMRRVRHPNVVRLHEVMATRSKIYFVMEFAKGGELFTKVARGRFSEDLSRRYFRQLVAAVGQCHAQGVFHRDLKPENLLLDDNWDLKVSDFGLSAVRDDAGTGDLLQTLCGTPAYVAPEILAKKGYDGAKADVWSCGVILFVLVAGYLPFNDTNLMAMYRKIYNGQYRFPKWASPELRRFVSRLLDANPATRITVPEILDDPWFRHGGYIPSEPSPAPEDHHFDLKPADPTGKKCLNAFDIISLSPGLDLSGMFWNAGGAGLAPVRTERFLSAEAPERIIERAEEVAGEEGLAVTQRTECGARLEGCDGSNSPRTVLLEVYRLTSGLAVVHVKEREEEVGPVHQVPEIWKDKWRPRLGGFLMCDSNRKDDNSTTGRH